jgi:hypothetical protein
LRPNISLHSKVPFQDRNSLEKFLIEGILGKIVLIQHLFHLIKQWCLRTRRHRHRPLRSRLDCTIDMLQQGPHTQRLIQSDWTHLCDDKKNYNGDASDLGAVTLLTNREIGALTEVTDETLVSIPTSDGHSF